MYFRNRFTLILFLGFLSLSQAAVASGLRDDEPEIDPAKAAALLLDSSDVEMQAVGLLLQRVPVMSAEGALEVSGKDIDLDKIDHILDSATSPAVIAILASVCAASDQIEPCRSLGVEEAIIEHDKGNILFRAAFLGGDRTVWRNTISSRPFAHDRYFEVASLVHQALLSYAVSESIEYSDPIVGVQVSSFTGSVAMPRFSPLIKTCREGGADLLAGCRHIADAMIGDSPSLISLYVGLDLMQIVEEKEEDVAAVARWEDGREALQTYLDCLNGIPMEFYENMTSDAYQQWLDISARSGELAAFEHWASEYGIDCAIEREALGF